MRFCPRPREIPTARTVVFRSAPHNRLSPRERSIFRQAKGDRLVRPGQTHEMGELCDPSPILLVSTLRRVNISPCDGR